MIKIVSDGTGHNTQVYDDAGHLIKGIVAITWTVDGEHPDRLARATLTVDAEINAEAEVDAVNLLDRGRGA